MTANTARRWLGSAALAAVALVLAACTTMPTSGPVNEGTGVVSSAEPFVPIAVGPRLDDSPTMIVNGFVRAVPAGFASDFSVAREFLTPEARKAIADDLQNKLGLPLNHALTKQILPALGPDCGLCLLSPEGKQDRPQVLVALRVRPGSGPAPAAAGAHQRPRPPECRRVGTRRHHGRQR